jgi:hypothetical protein
MDGHAYIGELLSVVFFLIAGARLLGLSRRTRETPELLLGLAFVVSGIALLLYLMPYVHFFEALWTPFIFAGRVACGWASAVHSCVTVCCSGDCSAVYRSV